MTSETALVFPTAITQSVHAGNFRPQRKIGVSVVFNSPTPSKRGVHPKQKKLIKYFGFMRYGTLEKAFEAARKWRAEYSDLHGLTKQVVVPYYKSGRVVPLSAKQYISGLIDGDGSITIDKPSGLVRGYTPRIKFLQSCDAAIPEVMLFIQAYYGGSIIKSAQALDKKGVPIRQKYIWECRVQDLRTFAQDMVEVAVIKKQQYEQVLLCLDTSQEDKTTMDSLYQTLKRMHHSPAEVVIEPERLIAAWLGGIWDAEGYVGLCAKNGLTVSLTQKDSPVLAALQKIHGGFISKHWVDGLPSALVFSSQAAIVFLESIHGFVIGKLSQVSAVLQYRRDFPVCTSQKRSKEGEKALKDIREFLSKEKRL